MKLLKTLTTDNKIEFIDHWSKLYNYDKEELYDNNICKKLNKISLFELFEWKNGGTISKKKQGSITTNYIPFMNNIPLNQDIVKIKNFIENSGGAIWSIFFIHIHYPNIYPIYDQHVHRAMAFISKMNGLEIPTKNHDKIELYFNSYIPFYNSFKPINNRLIDKGLWAFGKFLKDYPIILNSI